MKNERLFLVTVIMIVPLLAGCGGASLQLRSPPASAPDGDVDWGVIEEAKRTERTPKWLDGPIDYLLVPQERAALKSLAEAHPNGIDDAVWSDVVDWIWARRDPSPATDGRENNEVREEFYRRVAETENGFRNAGPKLRDRSVGMAGWRSDRGYTYIVFGEPFDIEMLRSGSTSISTCARNIAFPDPLTFDVQVWCYHSSQFPESIQRQLRYEYPIIFARSSMRRYHFYAGFNPQTGAPREYGTPSYIQALAEAINRVAIQRSHADETMPGRVRSQTIDPQTMPLPFRVQEIAAPYYQILLDYHDLYFVPDHDTNTMQLPLWVGLGFDAGDDAPDGAFRAPAEWLLSLALTDDDMQALAVNGQLSIVIEISPAWARRLGTVTAMVREGVYGRSQVQEFNALEHTSSGLVVSQPMVVRRFLSRSVEREHKTTEGLYELSRVAIVGPFADGDSAAGAVVAATGLALDDNGRSHVAYRMRYLNAQGNVVVQEGDERGGSSILFTMPIVPLSITVTDVLSGEERVVYTRHHPQRQSRLRK